MKNASCAVSLLFIFSLVIGAGFSSVAASGRSLHSVEMAAIYGGGGQPQPVVANAKCVTSTACNIQQTTCGQNITQAACLGSGQSSVYSGNRDYCDALLPGDAPQDCQEGEPYTCAVVQQCTWQNGACVVLLGGAQNTIQVPSACANIAQGP